ncbi:alpha/beta hydrolase [Nitrosomonas supralitoralis]|uniref:Esterase n=1 Tax=Nitrosomonas supralitoralis TaxID=2116706 RepID=A0A2P7NRZ8_9PROT|nr:alpha/beta fold hydrolase [Nitrosomonas supralitoralis]PSJ16242.1 esterase [Nitrosomonas supralitoralis]
MLYKPLFLILVLTLSMMLSIFVIGTVLISSAPTAVGTLTTDFPVEAVQIPAMKGPTVHGWLVYGKLGNGVVLLVHSMRSNRLEMLSRARFLKNQGYSVLFIDLQAHGETAGDNITFGLRESENVEAAVAFLRKIFPTERIGAIGTSLGAAAIVLAKQDLRLNAVILESLHPTIEEAVENRLKLHFGDHGLLLLPLMLWQLTSYLDTTLDALSPIARINDLSSPVLFISGTDDMHTTQSETERLFDAARTPKDLWIVPGARHFNMHTYAGRAYEQRVNTFLSRYLRGLEDR